MSFRIKVPQGILAVACWLFAFHVAAGPPAVQHEMHSLVAFALARNPRILAVRQQIEQVVAARQGNQGFFEPQVRASTGLVNDPADGNDSAQLLGGTEIALRPGAYFSLTAEENYFRNVAGSYDQFGQTVVTAGVRVPLLRDRGFRVWKLGDLRDQALIDAANRRLTAVEQEVRLDVETRFLACQEALVSGTIARAATQRVEKLLKDAEELVKLKTVPEYQLFPARLEVELRRVEETAARQTYETAVLRLAAALGVAEWRLEGTETTPEILIAWATLEPLPESPPMDTILAARGAIAAVDAALVAADYDRSRNRESLRSDVNLEVAGSWQGESPDSVIDGGVLTQERNQGGLVALTWRQPLGFRAERARLRQDGARLTELREQRRELELAVQADLAVAITNYRRARERLDKIGSAVDAARKTLAAEEERFQLGEGRSRNVLDAQKDLTTTIQLQTAIAAELLRVRSAFHYATGYAVSSEK